MYGASKSSFHLLISDSLYSILFFLIFIYYRLENLMEEINAKCQSVKTAPSQSKDWQPKVGEVCLAKFHEDER